MFSERTALSTIKPQKIAIIGCAGSGKTTLAFKLHKQLKLPLYHLDQYYWEPGWKRVDFDKFTNLHNGLCDQDQWIIEGSYSRTLYYRVMSADLVIFLDMPRHVCMWNVIKRTISNWGKVIPGSPNGCKQQIFNYKFFEFWMWIWNFKKRSRENIMNVLHEFKDVKPIHIVQSFEEIENLLILKK